MNNYKFLQLDTLENLKGLVENEVQESLHIEYKCSLALSKKTRDEIAKDVSAMANADGGQIVYGMQEKNHLPEKLDNGVSNQEITREWLDNILSANISPSIPGLVIKPIPKNNDKSYYVINIPKSYSGPHQAPTKCYYKRYNFKSSPMEDYEIQDIRNRQLTVSRLVTVDIEIEKSILFVLSIFNPGSHPAENVTFEFSSELPWRKNNKPPAFDKGIKYLPPGRKLKFPYHSALDLFNGPKIEPMEFNITTEYDHPELNSRHSETFLFDFNDFSDSMANQEPYEIIAKKIESGLREIAKAVKTEKL